MKAPRTQKPKKYSRCHLCKEFSTDLSYVNNLQGNIIVQKKSIPQKDILLKTIPAQNILTLNQIKQLKTKSTHFAPKFCKACFQKYSSPELFQECQNKNCVRVPIGEPILEPNLQLFEKIPEKQFRLCKVKTARFCQNCRQANLSKAELRLFNQLLDRTLKGKSVAIVNSQRTYRASNFGGKLNAPSNCRIPGSFRKRN